MEKLLVQVKAVDSYGAEIVSLDSKKPKGCPGLGGWKKDGDYWTTRIKGESTKLFLVHTYPTISLDGDKIISVE